MLCTMLHLYINTENRSWNEFDDAWHKVIKNQSSWKKILINFNLKINFLENKTSCEKILFHIFSMSSMKRVSKITCDDSYPLRVAVYVQSWERTTCAIGLVGHVPL